MNKALIIGSGDFYFPDSLEGITVIACDGGLDHCKKNGIKPDFILGDFDSVSNEALAFFADTDKKQYPVKKDMTDLELGIRLAIEKGARDITVTGALSSSRFDHSLCNIQLLILCLKEGIKARVLNKTNTIMLVDKNNSLKIENCGRYVSLLPLTEKVEGVTLRGFEYPLENHSLQMGTSLCISNIISEDMGAVSVSEGVLAVIAAADI